jgi:Rv2525c-like, glycoside hydrolase-like domain
LLKSVKPVLLVAALILSACQSVPAPHVEQPRGLARGVDLPTDASDVLNELRGGRLDFVARYYRDPTSRWPALTAPEARRLSSLGLKIVTVWEWHSHDPAYFTYGSGYGDAVKAYRQAKAVGQPPGSAIYFGVDFNARGPDLYRVDNYFRGVAAGLTAASRGRPEYRVGVYGSGAVCAAVKAAGLARYAWLSNSRAWAGSAGYTGWNIKQVGRFANLSFSHDANEARDDYGGFRVAGPVPAAPALGGVSPVVAAPPPPRDAIGSLIGSLF